jgi:thymidylate kinase
MIIAIDGPDGAGKSTHVAMLRDWLQEKGVPCAVVSKWDVFDPSLHPEARFLRGTELQELRLCVAEMPTPARALFIMWLYAEAADRAVRLAGPHLVILDGYWLKHAAAEVAYGCDPKLIDALAGSMGFADVVLYLDVTPEEALVRKAGALTPYECGLDPARGPDKFLAQQTAIRNTMREWAERDGWRRIAASSVEEEQREIRELVLSLLPPELAPAARSAGAAAERSRERA